MMLWLPFDTKKFKIMKKKAEFELMQKVARELEDLKNSQEAVIKKVSQIEAHSFELSNSTLDDFLSDIHENVANNLEKVAQLNEAFQKETNEFATENSAALAAEE